MLIVQVLMSYRVVEQSARPEWHVPRSDAELSQSINVGGRVIPDPPGSVDLECPRVEQRLAIECAMAFRRRGPSEHRLLVARSTNWLASFGIELVRNLRDPRIVTRSIRKRREKSLLTSSKSACVGTC